MNNSTIIANEAIASGYFTEKEIERFIEENRDIPFHTYSVWKDHFGMIPRKGSIGWETRLWRKKECRTVLKPSEDSASQNFYLAKSFLFHISQMEKVK